MLIIKDAIFSLTHSELAINLSWDYGKLSANQVNATYVSKTYTTYLMKVAYLNKLFYPTLKDDVIYKYPTLISVGK